MPATMAQKNRNTPAPPSPGTSSPETPSPISCTASSTAASKRRSRSAGFMLSMMRASLARGSRASAPEPVLMYTWRSLVLSSSSTPLLQAALPTPQRLCSERAKRAAVTAASSYVSMYMRRMTATATCLGEVGEQGAGR